MTAPATQAAPAKTGRKSPAGKRFRVPTVLQMEATECGAASLAMILAYHGSWQPLETLRVLCGVSRDGSKAANVLRAARKFGLKAKGFKKELDQLGEMTFPMIIFWNFNHFLVLEGIDPANNRVWVNDPAMGPRTVTWEEFDESFTGVVLVFEKDEGFKKGGTKPELWGKLWARLSRTRLPLAFVVLATLGLVVPGLVIPVFSKVFVDEVLVKDATSWLMPLLIGMVLTLTLRGCLTWLQQIILARMEIKMAITSSAAFFWHAMRLPIDFYNQRYPADISNRVQSNDNVAALLSGPLATSIVGLVSLVFYAAVMLAYDWMLTVIGVSLALLNLVVLRVVSRAREDGSRRLVKDAGLLHAVTIGGVQMAETLKASGQEGDFFSKWAGVQAKYLNAQQGLAFYSTILNAVPELLAALTTAVILGVGGLRVMDGVLTVGGLVAFQSLMSSFSGPVRGLVQLGGQLQTVKGDLARIDDVLNYQVDERLTRSELPAEYEDPAVAAQRLSGAIEIRDLTFGYNITEKPLVDGLSLSIRPGQRVALVGGSGSGKSTVAKLVCGLYRPWSGDILFDGVALNDLPRYRFTSSVASVDQEIFLFEGTVRENLSMWDPTVTEADIARALRDAEMLDVIEQRPGRFDAKVAENGTNFSGGQRQRLEIARALVANPTILILDEATSALDPMVEKRIDDHIRRRGCTCLIVAHRLSTIRDCDEIIVLDRGRVAQRGTHEDLAAVEGPYQRLISAEKEKEAA